MNNIKTELLMPDLPNNFEIKNMILIINKDRNNKYDMKPVYIQGILYPDRNH